MITENTLDACVFYDLGKGFQCFRQGLGQ